ncbi:MAG: lactate utilization protein C [Deltaproteobacteria bacterium]|nr:lactate utilization protein C [Deltaproteobacteria bacterium]
MITGKEQFISRISHCLGRTAVPEKPDELIYPHTMQKNYLDGASSAEITKTFITNARAVGITVNQCRETDLAATILDIVRDLGGPIMLADDPLLSGETTDLLGQEFNSCHIWDTSGGREENIARSEEAKVGIAVAESAMAESATSLLFSQRGSGRSVTLLPENSLIIIRAETIRPRLTQAMEILQNRESLPPSINFISGPSSTADIELVRVQGVHGPLELIYLIIE